MRKTREDVVRLYTMLVKPEGNFSDHIHAMLINESYHFALFDKSSVRLGNIAPRAL
jgi:hypothetical protein